MSQVTLEIVAQKPPILEDKDGVFRVGGTRVRLIRHFPFHVRLYRHIPSLLGTRRKRRNMNLVVIQVTPHCAYTTRQLVNRKPKD